MKEVWARKRSLREIFHASATVNYSILINFRPAPPHFRERESQLEYILHIVTVTISWDNVKIRRLQRLWKIHLFSWENAPTQRRVAVFFFIDATWDILWAKIFFAHLDDITHTLSFYSCLSRLFSSHFHPHFPTFFLPFTFEPLTFSSSASSHPTKHWIFIPPSNKPHPQLVMNNTPHEIPRKIHTRHINSG